MKDIELPPMPKPQYGYLPDGKNDCAYAAFSERDIQTYARAAVEADRAQRVPDVWSTKKDFRWDGERQHHVPQLIVEFEPVPFDGPCNAKGWMDRDAVASLLASAPAQPAQQEPDWKDMYEKEKRRSAMWVAKYEKDIGPLEYAVPVAHQEPPQQERKPMTEEQFEDWWATLSDYNIAGRRMYREQAVKLLYAIERHYGIRE